TAATNPEIADFTRRCWRSFVIDQLRFVTVQKLSAASVTHVAVVIRYEHVEHLCRSNSIENFYAESSLPFFTELRRQSLSGRYAETQTRGIKRSDVAMMLTQHAIDDRHT